MFFYQGFYNNGMFYNPYMNYLIPFMNFQYSNYFNQSRNSIYQSPTIQKRNKIPSLKERFDIPKAPTTEKTVTQTKPVEKKEINNRKQIKYNKTKGELLAKNVVEGLPAYRDPANPLCARYVKNAIVKSGLGPYINGNGEYCKYILRANENFKEIKIEGKDLEKLPAGTIVVYDAFTPCIDADGNYNEIGKDGHVLIMLGDGRGCSDIIEEKIPITDNAYVFIPV